MSPAASTACTSVLNPSVDAATPAIDWATTPNYKGMHHNGIIDDNGNIGARELVFPFHAFINMQHGPQCIGDAFGINTHNDIGANAIRNRCLAEYRAWFAVSIGMDYNPPGAFVVTRVTVTALSTTS